MNAMGNAMDAIDDCDALGEAVDLIGEKWTILVVGSLAVGPVRFNELRRRVDGVTPSNMAVAACSRCGKSENCLPCMNMPMNSVMPMCTALHTGAICNSQVTRRIGIASSKKGIG